MTLHVRLELADACGVPAEHELEFVVPLVHEHDEGKGAKRMKQEQGQAVQQGTCLEGIHHAWDDTGHRLTSQAVIAIKTQLKDYDYSHAHAMQIARVHWMHLYACLCPAVEMSFNGCQCLPLQSYMPVTRWALVCQNATFELAPAEFHIT